MAGNAFCTSCCVLDHLLSSARASYMHTHCFRLFVLAEADNVDACLFKTCHFNDCCFFFLIFSRAGCDAALPVNRLSWISLCEHEPAMVVMFRSLRVHTCYGRES